MTDPDSLPSPSSAPPNASWSLKPRRSLPSRRPSFQRRPSSSAAPPSLELPSGSSSGYVSFRDLILPPPSSPSPSIHSPTTDEIELPISNPLVKHAAKAYLQPTPSPSLSGRRRHRPLCSCFDFIALLFRPHHHDL
ncbi:proline-rich receptor-like protein kinase PERK12 [Dioscorea cayenensis subsp. rotundata]|uniref:Proline-rich receptor-like protein kinase PERK12 n=1 Tax=Dioscorea cayennensis subsp. rotundata TaxID=55577 RepID=A0AB40BFT6_DIOCR|nr:proline-rich receptor-like protein kinase PERK12 [Dioscorea cayenensis subsp. rotundata]